MSEAMSSETRQSGTRWTPGAPSAQQRELRTALRTGIYGTCAIAALVVGSLLGQVHTRRIEPRVVIWLATAVFVIAGIGAVRQLARLLEQTVATRRQVEAGTALRVTVTIAGYVIVLFATLGLISVPLAHLAIGGAIVGVVVGIAAQQALGNLFAGIVLLLARPFRLGDHIRIRSGALGGELDGVVRAMNLTYVLLATEQGPLNIPNSALLAAGIGPWRKPAVTAVVAPPTEAAPLDGKK